MLQRVVVGAEDVEVGIEGLDELLAEAVVNALGLGFDQFA